MKHLNLSLSVLLLVCAHPTALVAQGTDWVKVSPPGEEFTVQIPRDPTTATLKISSNDLSVDGYVYTAVAGETSYTAWSLKRTTPLSPKQNYLDLCADLVWDRLLQPVRDKLPSDKYVYAHMDYVDELSGRDDPGREYVITLDKTSGVTNFYVDNEKIYILMVLNGRRDAPETQRFLKSFSAGPAPLPVILKVPVLNPAAADTPDGGMGAGVGPGRGGGIGAAQPAPPTEDPNRIFTGRDVTQKVRVFSQPNPDYSDSARKYSVQGTVTIRAVFSKDGAVTNIKVAHGLPHGLTEKAIEAAREVKFEPAEKDGRKVSQYILLEYHFSLH